MDTYATGSKASKALLDNLNITEYYEHRKRWCGGYPLIHGRDTYGAFDDLAISPEAKLKLIPVAMDIALNEEDEYFHCAIAMLREMIPVDRISTRPIGFGEQLILLRERVVQLNHQPNITATWGALAVNARCLKPVEDDRSYAIPASRMGVSCNSTQ